MNEPIRNGSSLDQEPQTTGGAVYTRLSKREEAFRKKKIALLHRDGVGFGFNTAEHRRKAEGDVAAMARRAVVRHLEFLEVAWVPAFFQLKLSRNDLGILRYLYGNKDGTLEELRGVLSNRPTQDEALIKALRRLNNELLSSPHVLLEIHWKEGRVWLDSRP